MIYFVKYVDATGEITSSGFSPNPRTDQPLDEGEALLEGCEADPSMHYVRDGEIVAFPPRPNSWSRFDFAAQEWFDPRTAADMLAALYAAREATTLDKSTLLIRMAMAGMLPAEDAEIAAGGVIPPTIQAALDALPPEVFPPEAQMIARIKWRSDNVISRVNPVIVLAAAALGVTDEQMDAIFDVQVPA